MIVTTKSNTLATGPTSQVVTVRSVNLRSIRGKGKRKSRIAHRHGQAHPSLRRVLDVQCQSLGIRSRCCGKASVSVKIGIDTRLP